MDAFPDAIMNPLWFSPVLQEPAPPEANTCTEETERQLHKFQLIFNTKKQPSDRDGKMRRKKDLRSLK